MPKETEHWCDADAEKTLHSIFSPSFGAPSISRLDRICRRHGLRLLALFGSQCSGTAHSESDVDIGILPEPRRRPNLDALYVDLVPVLGREELDIVDLRTAPPVLRAVIVRDGVVLWARSAEEWLQFANRAVYDFDDELPTVRFRQDRLDRVLSRRTAHETA